MRSNTALSTQSYLGLGHMMSNGGAVHICPYQADDGGDGDMQGRGVEDS